MRDPLIGLVAHVRDVGVRGPGNHREIDRWSGHGNGRERLREDVL